MDTDNGSAALVGEEQGYTAAQRETLALMLASAGWPAPRLPAAEAGTPVHLAISEREVGDVNLNDARAAMLVWIKRLTDDLNMLIDPRLFNSTREIVDRTRKGQLDPWR